MALNWCTAIIQLLKLIKTTISSNEGCNLDFCNTQKHTENFDRLQKIVVFESDPQKYLQIANTPKQATFFPQPRKNSKPRNSTAPLPLPPKK